MHPLNLLNLTTILNQIFWIHSTGLHTSMQHWTALHWTDEEFTHNSNSLLLLVTIYCAPPFLWNNNEKTETKTTAWCRSQGGCISIYKCIQLKNYKMHQQPNFAPRCTFLIITSLHYTSCMEYCVLLLLYSIVTFLCQISFLCPNLGSSQHSRHNSSAINCDWVYSKWAPNWLNFPMQFSKTSLVGAL